MLSAGQPNSVHGVMQVFTEFIRTDLTEDQILPVLRELLPALLAVLAGHEVCFCRLFRLLLNGTHLLLATLGHHTGSYYLCFPTMRGSAIHG